MKKEKKEAEIAEAPLEEKKTELEYMVAPIWRRFSAMIVDLFLIVLLATGLYAASDAIFKSTDSYLSVSETRAYYQDLSGLYIDEYNVVEYLEEQDDMTYREKKDELASVLDTFYQNDEFCDEDAYGDYNERKREGAFDYGVVALFVDSDGDGWYTENDSADPEDLYEWYSEDFLSYALGYLSIHEEYLETTRFLFWGTAVQIIIDGTLSLLVFWLLVPLAILRRGRMTIGRKLLSVAMLEKNALTPPWWKYLLRFLFIYFIYIWLGMFSFLLPELVSVAMQMLSKRQQDLAEYVLNQYSVDCKDKDVYLDYGDYQIYKDRKGRASLFNQDISDKNVARR